MAFCIWVENGHNFDRSIRIRIAQFDIQWPPAKILIDHFSLVGVDIILNVRANILIIESANVNSSSRLIREVYITGYWINFKYFIFVGPNLYFKLHIFTEGYGIYIFLVVMHWLHHYGVSCTVLASHHDYQRSFH